MRKARSDGAATREAILAAAEDEFAEKGYESASVRAICTRAGVNVALANRYFGTKEELYRLVARRLFGDLGAPMAAVARMVTDDAGWRAAVRAWVDDFLFMTIPTARAQRLCRGLFRHEVVSPTKFHAEFERAYGKPIFDSLRALIARVEADPVRVDLWISTVWSQITVYALADDCWFTAFRPEGVELADWRETIAEHICETLFSGLKKWGRGIARSSMVAW